MNKGQLVYIPSHVRLSRYYVTKGSMRIKDYCVLSEPRHLLVVDDRSTNEKEVGVHYNGDVWYVERSDIFIEAAE
tara:strand:- start:2538 stop:2762 length:225 start_codon:yes stop_codon:yes gene_type:complete